MNRERLESGWRHMAHSVALAAALFAITLNFLQPLAHAALMRDGVPSALWTMFCNSAAADPEGKSGSLPVSAQDHECCLGLAHAPALIAPPTDSITLPPIAIALASSLPVEPFASVGIRDGPAQPRGPPV